MPRISLAGIEEAVGAAQTAGGERLQKAARGFVVPDSFTHGASGPRGRWILQGFCAGRLSERDTFGVPYGQL